MRKSSCIGLMALGLMCLLAGSAEAKKKAACPYQNGYADGCAKAPADGNYINPNFFSYAKQSGQGTYYSDPRTPSGHPPPWNVAGVDYPVGYRTSIKLRDPAADALPAGCTYSGTGSPQGGAIVTCSGVQNLTIEGWDFSLHNCTMLDVKPNVTGKIVMDNNKFVNGPNCGVTNSYLMMIESQTYADFKFEHNYVDGKAQQFPQSLIGLIVPFVQGKMVLKYNAFLNAPARPVISMDTHAQLFEYNYWEGFVYQIDDGHSEVVMNYLGNDKYQPSITYSFNTGLETNQACNCGAAMWYATGDGQNTSIGSVMVDHNTSIVNKTKDGEVTLSAASAETSYDTYGSVVFQQNYMDPTGSYECFISTSNPTYKTPPQFIDNVDILNGKTVTDYGNCPT